ncbi:hypothetical protein [Leifsonia naganoensis]|uniref:Secreted protein n=1 Tax=Leifsonia naganoensis TaxID=150025 RepID=A0A853DMY2_9MICO|nr:hypothetical protein [Leifsonia naganoensis]NYK10436.1 hypothetical protein [Leifsonia naganoensis]
MSGFTKWRASAATLIVVGVLAGTPAVAARGVTTEVPDAPALIQQLSASDDPQALFESLNQDEREQVLALTEVADVRSASDEDEQRAKAMARAASGCYTYTARAGFYNSVGQTLGSMWTTGKICYNGANVTSATFVDGGGSTSFIGWSYVGRTSSAGGVSRGAGYVYGAYKFRFGLIAGYQEPVYCARVVGTSVAGHGDTGCGVG